MLSIPRILMMKQKTTQEKQSLKERFIEKKYRLTQSNSYRKLSKTATNHFEVFLKEEKQINSLEELQKLYLENKMDPIKLADDYLTYLRNYTTSKDKRLRNGPIRVYMILTKELLRFIGCKIYNEDFKQEVKLPPKQETEEDELEKEEIRPVLRNAPLEIQLALLMECSGGMRIGEICQLTLDDIDFNTNPATISLRAEIVKGKSKPRKTHITNEATTVLKEYLAKEFNWPNWNKPNNFIFMRTQKERLRYYQERLKDSKLEPKSRNHIVTLVIPKLEEQLSTLSNEELYEKSVENAVNDLEHKLIRVVDNLPKLSKRYSHGFRKIHFHALRSWFQTICSDCGFGDFGEALSGRGKVRYGYYRKNDKKRIAVYRKIEPALTISDYSQVEKNITRTTDDYQELKEQFKTLQEQFSTLLAQTRPNKS